MNFLGAIKEDLLLSTDKANRYPGLIFSTNGPVVPLPPS